MAAGQWYRDGSVTVTNGSEFVVGAGTAWSTQAEVGDGFSVTENGITRDRYEIVKVLDNYNIKLNAPYQGESATEAEYAIERNWTGRWILPTKTVADTAELNREMRRMLENELQGRPGDPGEDANRILDGEGAPGVNLGLEDYYYFDNLSWDFYHKVAGVWTLIGNIRGGPGTPGTNGTQIFEGNGVPATSLGLDGDYYLNRDNGDMYRKVAQTGWHISMNLKGPQGEGIKGDPGESITGAPGEPGSKWHSSTVDPPAASLGVNTDMCMISTGAGRGKFYQKTGGAWVYQGTVQGQIGNPGVAGPVGVNPRGPWAADATYAARDYVSHLGSSWYALKESLGAIPMEGEYWTLMASKGDAGDGSGDMTTATYDPQKTGTVNSAREAAHAVAADSAAVAAVAESIDPDNVDHNAIAGLQGGKNATPEDPDVEMFHLAAVKHAALEGNPALSGDNPVASMSDLPSTDDFEMTENKGVANGYAELGADGIVPAAQSRGMLRQFDLQLPDKYAVLGEGETSASDILARCKDFARWRMEEAVPVAMYVTSFVGDGSTEDIVISLYINGTQVNGTMTLSNNGNGLPQSAGVQFADPGINFTPGAVIEIGIAYGSGASADRDGWENARVELVGRLV